MDPTSLLLIVAAGVAGYFLLIRPAKQRQRQQQQLIESLRPGAEVMTASGVFGTVAAVTDEEVSVEVSPGVYLRMVPAAIARVIETLPAPDDTVD